MIMKKVLSVLLVAVMLVAVLASCNTHEHVFATDAWTFDDDYHWRACTAEEGCKEQSEKAEHDFEVIIGDDGNPVNSCKVCGATNTNVQTAPEHEHEFADEFSANNNFHWHACKVEGCYETPDKAEHAFGNPEVTYADKKIIIKRVCIDCAYEAIEEQEVETEVDNSVSWNEAFKNFKLTNFTMEVYFDYSGYKHVNHCVVTDTAAYYCIPDAKEYYTVPNSDGTYTTYARSGSENHFWKVSDNSNKWLIAAQTETVIQVSFEDNFDKFVYDEASGSYVCADPIGARAYMPNGEDYMDMFCYNNVVKLTDGKISYIEAEYYFEESEKLTQKKSFKYYNIGISAVEVPRDVIDNAVAGDPWENDYIGGGSSDEDIEHDVGGAATQMPNTGESNAATNVGGNTSGKTQTEVTAEYTGKTES